MMSRYVDCPMPNAQCSFNNTSDNLNPPTFKPSRPITSVCATTSKPPMKNHARLRTKSGCLICRQRRKKCDETKPVCLRCRGSYECRWPTEQDNAKDRRFRKTGTSSSSANNTIVPIVSRQAKRPNSNVHLLLNEEEDSSLSPEEEVEEVQRFLTPPSPDKPVNFSMDQEPVLLAYYVHTLLPSFVHLGSHSQYKDSTYMSLMISKHKPLRDTALACASMTLSWKLSSYKNWHMKMGYKAYYYHQSAVAAVQAQVRSGSVDGTEDWLLATANQLTMFDSQDHEIFASTISVHIDSVMNLIKCRELAKQTPTWKPQTQMSLNTEQLCYECLLYYGATRMAIDPSFSLLSENWDLISNYFRYRRNTASTSMEEYSPVIGMPFDLFELAVTASHLARQIPLSDADLETANVCVGKLSKWYDLVPKTKEFSTAYLYLVATHALLKHILRGEAKRNEWLEDNKKVEDEVGDIIDILASGPKGVRFPLWPLCVLYSIRTDEHQKSVLKSKISNSLQNLDHATLKSASHETIKIFLAAPGLRNLSGTTSSDAS